MPFWREAPPIYAFLHFPRCFFCQFMLFWPKIKHIYALFKMFFGAKRRPFLSIFCMLFSPRSGEKFFMHFLYAFRAKREKNIILFFKHLCFFDQTFKKKHCPELAELASARQLRWVAMILRWNLPLFHQLQSGQLCL